MNTVDYYNNDYNNNNYNNNWSLYSNLWLIGMCLNKQSKLPVLAVYSYIYNVLNMYGKYAVLNFANYPYGTYSIFMFCHLQSHLNTYIYLNRVVVLTLIELLYSISNNRTVDIDIESPGWGFLAYCETVFFTLVNLAKKITSAYPSDLLSSNMAVQLSSWPIRIYFPNPGQ